MTVVAQKLEMGKTEAMNLFNTDLTPYIQKFMTDIVNPWYQEHFCIAKNSQKKKAHKDFEQVCDLSAVNLETPGKAISLSCGMAFVCGTNFVDTSNFEIASDSVYIGESATLQNVVPAKASAGDNGVNPGESGKNGANGLSAFSMALTSNKLLKNSAKQLIFISQGGAGGDGGNGKLGKLF